MDRLPQSPLSLRHDPRDMFRRYIVERSLASMERARLRRERAVSTAATAEYVWAIRDAVRAFYGPLPTGANTAAPRAVVKSAHVKSGYRIENVLFESFPGWEVNASVYVPLDHSPPYPAVVVPVGHSGKQFESYQIPCQFFARSGYLAVTFDPPGQSGEKQQGNDHFADGARCYLVGETSSRYFVADALRCVDYVLSRPDVDGTRGVAMTGVSGGGTTTTLAGLLDDRITALGPSCCVTPLADLDITQCYAGCPETHMWRRYAEGIDEVDLVCAAAPKPLMLMAGRTDVVFRIEDTRVLSDEVARFYAATGADGRYVFFEDNGGHAYSLDQSRAFTRFMNRWLRGEPDAPVCGLPDGAFLMDPYEHLQCRPRVDVNMRSLTLARAQELAATRSSDPSAILAAARLVCGVETEVPCPESLVGEPFRVWTHTWRQVVLAPEPGIELPGTWLHPVNGRRPAVLHLDDGGRHRLLTRNGPLTQAARFLDSDAETSGVFSLDLRGWGDTEMADYPYELAGWGGVDRYTAYATAALGDHAMAMRVRDGLAALAWLRTQPDVLPDGIVVTGTGLGGVVALHVGAIGGAKGVVTWNTLGSFLSLLEAGHYVWSAEAFLPNVLLHYDLPDLAGAAPCNTTHVDARDGAGQPFESTKETFVRGGAERLVVEIWNALGR